MTVFHNEPQPTEREGDKDFDTKRQSLVAEISDYLSTHEKFRGKQVGITFAASGSLTSIVESSGKKFVFKIFPHTKAEAQFLNAWEKAGVRVPHVIEEGRMGEYAYILMEHVDAPTLANAYAPEELAEKGIYREMGQLLRRMHAAKAEGYGPVIGGNATHSEFREWFLGAHVIAAIAYGRAHLLLGEEHGSMRQAFEILQAHISEQNHSSYCHDDFSAANILATDPMTVVDPNPIFNNGYIDLGRSLVIHISQGISQQRQLVEGYFAGGDYSERVLHAAVLLNAYLKFCYWHNVKKSKRIENVQNYLRERRELLA